MSDWRDRIKVGDVLLTKRGNPRIVRKATYRPAGRLHCVTFTIKTCSWTKRCTTVLNRHDLKHGGYTSAGVTIKTMTRMDKIINRCIINHERLLDCCDVRGIA